jgi:hypothetical protein
MIITLSAFAVFIAGIVGCAIYDRMIRKSDWLWITSILLALVGFIISMFLVFAIIAVNANKDIDYQNMLYEREMIEYRIDHMNENIVGNEMLYDDIVEFNNELRSIKKFANSPWTNWFNNEDIATIDYIELNSN